MHFDIITVVWGEAYLDLFTRLALPNQLTPGNLGCFRDGPHTATYKIMTTAQDAAALQQTPVFAQLADALPVEIVPIDDVNRGRRYDALSECHRRAIRAANARGAGLIFLSPDAIWSEGAFRHVCELLEQKWRAVLVAGLRVTRETFVPDYLARGSPRSPRAMVGLAQAHLHPVSRSLFWDAECFSYFPSHLYWRVAAEGFLARCFHLHPLAVQPSCRGLVPSSTIDADYLLRACPDLAELYVVRDSDELVGVEISSEGQFGSMPAHRAGATDVAFWARYHTNAHHLELVRQPIRFHHGECTSAWTEAEEQSERLLDDIDFQRLHALRFFPGRICRRAVVRAGTRLLQLLLPDRQLETLRAALVRWKLLGHNP
jgi:hypothetical protein